MSQNSLHIAELVWPELLFGVKSFSFFGLVLRFVFDGFGVVVNLTAIPMTMTIDIQHLVSYSQSIKKPSLSESMKSGIR